MKKLIALTLALCVTSMPTFANGEVGKIVAFRGYSTAYAPDRANSVRVFFQRNSGGVSGCTYDTAQNAYILTIRAEDKANLSLALAAFMNGNQVTIGTWNSKSINPTDGECTLAWLNVSNS